MLCFHLSQTLYLDKIVSISVSINMETNFSLPKFTILDRCSFSARLAATRYFQHIKALHNKYYSKPKNKTHQILKSSENQVIACKIQAKNTTKPPKPKTYAHKHCRLINLKLLFLRAFMISPLNNTKITCFQYRESLKQRRDYMF